MNLTTEALTRFIHGQMEIQSLKERCLYRGEIISIVVESGRLEIRLAWIAKCDDDPLLPKRWINDEQSALKIYRATLEACTVGNIEYCLEGGERLRLYSPIFSEAVLLYTPDSSRLDRSRVEGL